MGTRSQDMYTNLVPATVMLGQVLVTLWHCVSVSLTRVMYTRLLTATRPSKFRQGALEKKIEILIYPLLVLFIYSPW